ncbi:MAG: adenylate/guanylate cyclase domain-containing protein [Bacteroidota bacterium]
MKPKNTYFLILFILWGIFQPGYAQSDSTQAPLPLADSAHISALLEQINNTTRKARAKDSLYLELADSLLQISQALPDTNSWIRSLAVKSYWLRDNDQAPSADALDSLRKKLVGDRGFILRDDFSNGSQYYDFNISSWSLKVYVDSMASLSFDSISSGPFQAKFEPNYTEDQGLDSTVAYWVKIRLKGNGSSYQENLLFPNYSDFLWKEVSFFKPDRNGNWIEHKGGGSVLLEEKMTADWHDFYPINLGATEDLTVYFRLKGFRSYNTPTNLRFLQIHASYLVEKNKSNTRAYAFLGVLLFLTFFYFFWYLTAKEKTFIPYIFYILGIAAITWISMRFRYWFPYPDFDRESMMTSSFLLCAFFSGLGKITFTQMFLDTKERIPTWHKIFRIFQWVFSLIMIFIVVYAFFETSNEELEELLESLSELLLSLFALSILTGLVLIYAASIVVWRRGFEPAKFYLLAISSLVISVGVLGLEVIFNSNLLESYDQYMLLIQSGVLLQLCFFALGMGFKRNLLEREKVEVQAQLLEEQNKVNTAFGRFVPHNFLKAIGRDSVLDVKLGDGVEQEVSVFFSDIRGYTRLSEQMNPKENFRFLNGYLGRMGPIISEYEGFVNQYYGDGIMAIFMQSPRNSVQASVEIHKRLRIYNEERSLKGRERIKIGIGLHAGPLMMGIIGDTLRMDAGVVSDTVNTAARMEGLTKHFGVNILISETVFGGLRSPEAFHYRYLGKVQVKGRQEPLKVFDFYDGDEVILFEKKQRIQADFDAGIQAFYDQNFPASIRALEKVLEVLEGDKTSIYYLEKAKTYLMEGVSANWTGTVEMKFK